MTNFLLTGRPGVGKTTVLRKVLTRLPVVAGGFFTEEIREASTRTGFRIVTTDRRTAVLSHIGVRSPCRVGRYGVRVESIDQVAVPALQVALREAALIVIDEIAKMELCSRTFQDIVVACLDSPKPVLGVIQRSRLPFLDRIRRHDDVEVIEVTPSNRETLPAQLVVRLAQML